MLCLGRFKEQNEAEKFFSSVPDCVSLGERIMEVFLVWRRELHLGWVFS